MVTARFGFGGRSSYAPDLVLVNEFIKKDFLEAVVRQSITFLTDQNGSVSGKKPRLGVNASGDEILLDEVRKDGSASIIASGSKGTIIDVEKRYGPPDCILL